MASGLVVTLLSDKSYHPAPIKAGMEYPTDDANIGKQLTPVERAIARQALDLVDKGQAYATPFNNGLDTEVYVSMIEQQGRIRRDAIDVTVTMGNTNGKPDPSKVTFVNMESADFQGSPYRNDPIAFSGRLMMAAHGGEQTIADRQFLTNNYESGNEAGISGYYSNANIPQKDQKDLDIVFDTTDPTQLVNSSPVNTANAIAGYANSIWEELYKDLLPTA